MPLADLTAIANLALTHLGEPFLTNYATDTGTTAEAVRLHLPQAREITLEGHVWSFATRTEILAPTESYLDPDGNPYFNTPYNYYTSPDADEPYVAEFSSLYRLPDECLRVIKLASADIDLPQDRWEIQGRYLMLQTEASDSSNPLCYFITNSPPVDEWPTTFTDAVAYLLASRLAPLLAQDDRMAADLFQKHEIALGKARSKDTRETRSKENHTPRMLAARSGLVRSRYGATYPPF